MIKLKNKNNRTDRRDVFFYTENLGTLDQFKGGWTLTPSVLGDALGLLEQDFKNLTDAKTELEKQLN